REVVAGFVRRGKVDCTLKLGIEQEAGIAQELDGAVLAALRALEKRVRADFPDAPPLSTAEVLRWLGALKERRLDHAALAEPIMRALRDAAESLASARTREGERLAALLEERNRAILAQLAAVRPLIA